MRTLRGSIIAESVRDGDYFVIAEATLEGRPTIEISTEGCKRLQLPVDQALADKIEEGIKNCVAFQSAAARRPFRR